ncbi:MULTISPECIES: prolipoprotein diacylglyceryl transferase [Spirosoma]|uniref:Phosphatidylglycerol--prolipoprotein diacylglyceryl transferase n=1 Tax=Spirosoma liriopis TaxID=2937440 RepID=A0ABT0HEK0_9BACT|nr:MULTISPECIES: prolipoprotein diacylglyceryl transferase [Spirosoma]MCK8490589.1 prolipoprotein diacylglyceryl transferase [Spirosoma liriopis]UHG89951.1 prolipoprotein diacylglyceryl transferase [Spirosoma oryzicola]
MLQYVIWDVNPEIFHIGSFSVRWYGLLFALGFLIGMQIMTYIFKKENKPVADTDTLLIYMVVATILGARIGHFLFYEPEVLFKNPLEVILPPYRGLASHGATVGILTSLWLYSRRKESRLTNQSFLWVTDRIVIVVALGGASIRLGNLMNSEIVGRPTDVPWAFVFMNNSEYAKIPRHPAQLYESLSCLVIFFVLLWFWNHYKERTPRGSMLGIFLIWVFGLRFFYEYLKENQVPFEDSLPLNVGQLLSIPAVLMGIYFLVRSYRTPVVLAEPDDTPKKVRS